MWRYSFLLVALLAQSAVAHDFKSIVSDGANVAYTDYGSGSPVIFLHGFSADFDIDLGAIGDALSKDYRVIGIDQRGHGRSDKPHDVAAYGKHFSADVLNLMDALHIEKANVVGHSMGGIVAMDLAANHPERIQSAVTIGNGLFKHWELTLIDGLMHGMFLWTDVKTFFGVAHVSPLKNDDDALMAAVSSLSELTVSEQQAATLKVPVLAARGGPKDDPHDTVERLVAINPRVEMLRIESEDHMSMVSNDAFRKALRAFLSRHNS